MCSGRPLAQPKLQSLTSVWTMPHGFPSSCPVGISAMFSLNNGQNLDSVEKVTRASQPTANRSAGEPPGPQRRGSSVERFGAAVSTSSNIARVSPTSSADRTFCDYLLASDVAPKTVELLVNYDWAPKHLVDFRSCL